MPEVLDTDSEGGDEFVGGSGDGHNIISSYTGHNIISSYTDVYGK